MANEKPHPFDLIVAKTGQKTIQTGRSGQSGRKRKVQDESKGESKDNAQNPPVPKKRKVVPRVEIKLDKPTPYQTDPLTGLFTITNGGTIYNCGSVEGGNEILFPSTLSVRDKPDNIKWAKKIQELITTNHTARAFLFTESTDLHLRFGRTVEEDLKYLPTFQAKQTEEKNRDEMCHKKYNIRRELETATPPMSVTTMIGSDIRINLDEIEQRIRELSTDDDIHILEDVLKLARFKALCDFTWRW
jgi:hypothetical protein